MNLPFKGIKIATKLSTPPGPLLPLPFWPLAVFLFRKLSIDPIRENTTLPTLLLSLLLRGCDGLNSREHCRGKKSATMQNSNGVREHGALRRLKPKPSAARRNVIPESREKSKPARFRIELDDRSELGVSGLSREEVVALKTSGIMRKETMGTWALHCGLFCVNTRLFV